MNRSSISPASTARMLLRLVTLGAVLAAPSVLAPGLRAQSTAGAGAATPQPSRADMARARRVLRDAPVVDGHNDLPWRIREDSVHPGDVAAYDITGRAPGMTDLPRLRTGRVGGQFWSVYIPGEAQDPAYARKGTVSSVPGFSRVQLEQIDIARRVIDAEPALAWATTAAEMRAGFRRGTIGSVLGLEGGHAIENSLALLRLYYELGARYMTLTHNVTLDWADAALDSARHGGLTPFGREVVREMNRLGMLVDLSHVSPATMSDALDATEAPVIFSHSNARALVDHPRNVPDSILRRMPRNGGVVMVTFVTAFSSPAVAADDSVAVAELAAIRRRRGSDTTSIAADFRAFRAARPRPKATLAQVADHIEHIRRVAGVDHVGLGGDFDGITENVVGLEDVSTYPALFAELSRRGWKDAELAKLSSGNVLRVMARAEQVARARRARS
jgi:membrane dipeptidase